VYKIFILAFTLILLRFDHVFPQDWECEKCPRRAVVVYGVDVPPAEDIGQSITPGEWMSMFMVTGSILSKLFNEDPSRECVNFLDAQMAELVEAEDSLYTYGMPHSFQPPDGSIESSDYLVTSSISGSGRSFVLMASLEAAGTREVVASGSIPYDLSPGSDNGGQIAQHLIPLMGIIRQFERRKRDENNNMAIYPNNTLKIKPHKDSIGVNKSMKVTIQLTDCDGVRPNNRSVKLSAQGGRFTKEMVVTGLNGQYEATFVAGNNPGSAKLFAEYAYTYPYGHEAISAFTEKDIKIFPRWTWEGKLTIDASETFQCEIEPTEENDWRQLSEHNFHTQKAEIDLMIEDIQIGEMVADVRIGGDMEVSGNITCMLSKSREFSLRPPYVICVKEPKRRSPGSWIYDKKTFNGHSSRPINTENFGLTIAKDVTDNTERLKELSEEMKSAGTDVNRLAELQGQMQQLLMGGGGNSKLKVQVVLNAEVRDQVLTSVFHQSYDACLGKTETDKDDQSTVEMPLGGIFNIIMDGTFTKDRYGINQITASFDSTATKTVDQGYGVCENAKITTLRCRLNLNKSSKKN
jgi:hypothetical protein